VIISFILSLFGVSCSRSGFENINVENAEKMIGSANKPLVIDVRTPEEYTGELGHIEGSRLMPLQSLADSLGILADYRDDDIILVCRSGNRSRTAGQMLVNAGFEKVYNLEGGMKAWNAYRSSK